MITWAQIEVDIIVNTSTTTFIINESLCPACYMPLYKHLAKLFKLLLSFINFLSCIINFYEL